VDRAIVPTGTRPGLKWGIEYPKTVVDHVVVGAEGGVTTRGRVRVRVRVVGVATGSGEPEVPVALWVRPGGSEWKQLFLGGESGVRPEEDVFDGVVEAGVRIDFGAGMQRKNGQWAGVHWTGESDPAVVGLGNGGGLPDYAPAFRQGRIEDYLSTYVRGDLTVKVGPREMLYLFELDARKPGDSAFDLQDLAVVVTFSEE